MTAIAPRAAVRIGRWSVRVDGRALAVGATLIAAIAAIAIAAVMMGDYPMTVGQTLAALFGVGDDELARYFVQDQRLPRVVAAVLVGAALAISGGVFQQLTANPLGSPDVIGFTIGAATGALIQIVLFDAGPAATALGATMGGFGTALVVYLLAWRKGLAGFRLVLVGIGVAAVLQGVNSLLVVRASLSAAQSAAQWLAGSFNATTWNEVALTAVGVGVFAVAAFALGRPLELMTMGDDIAAGLGIRVERTRLALVVVGVALVSIATAAAGPIAFVALAAPQLARRLTGSSAAGLVTSALMGAVLVLASDLAAQRLFAPAQLPVGVVTGSLGGVYLIWALAREGRRRP
ncbi:FecCD family ABC transporter permease [Microbacterium fluvii]|uniref:FecCD family ABC transporter permease n=1 Tax=Microbacterium fluvii TaxID=415215 RepID=A0ABW2HEH2_9MICO|nr:iron chelate uptake ABC transporter family permease subunit [Microbacterium fluvii]MCU4673146.1 iron chelate uptake ABC transporter family permease subunit [Microbacterium fluvii]